MSVSPKPKTKSKTQRQQRAKYRRARLRNFLFTVGPSRLSGGRISRRHLSKAIVVREVEVASPRWPETLDGLRIGHVSDFHLGELVTPARAVEAVELAARQQPDLVACTGDFVDLHHDGADVLFDALGALDAPLGVLAVLGNHDELHCHETVIRMARRAGVTVLDDDVVQIARHGTRLVAAGIGWASSSVACGRRVDRVCDADTHLLLAHNPRAFVAAAEIGVPLTLSGHTHGGQVAFRNRPNTNLAVAHRHSAGLFEEGPSRLFVTTGVGSWFPLRVNCPAEVVVLTMRHGPGTDTVSPRRRSRRRGERGERGGRGTRS